ncbi:prepilin-type N-terminal cleavage/methylation domain-containing protein [Patescibacteria group bacterium]|nr:prepilin-type N-terminal cleavage/methylation domain-containing protein [Patescibacteria group bacterium]
MRIFVKNKNRESRPMPGGWAGFTLIELLVVIAIIGLLASVVIVSLGDSRSRAKDSAIQSSLLEVAKVSESYAGDIGTYEGVCDVDNTTLSSSGNFGLIKSAIERQGGTISCQDSDLGFAVVSTMNLVDCWCVDWQAISREVILTAPATCASVLTDIHCP